MYIIQLRADIQLVWSEKSPGTDGYLNPLYVAIKSKDERLQHLNIWGVVPRHHSLEVDDPQTNARDGYW